MSIGSTAGHYVAMALIAFGVVLASGGAHAEDTNAASPGRSVTVVTLYSEARTPFGLTAKEPSGRPPIQIVDGGVKSAGDSCWEMDETGQIRTVPGECYILRSAAAGEKPPAGR
ncbi:hypothetical protein ACPCHQ_22145 [Ralstonia thomasii]|uniref:hypothetical protein n=1 Tax=Ralstonia thomasii TaxID=3058596 RepID=UPI003C2F9C27